MKQSPDKIFYNGKICSVPGTEDFCSAIAIKDNKILATGTDSEMFSLTSGEVDQVNLNQHCLIPGITDSHIHFLDYALSLSRLHLGDVENLNEFRRKIKRAVENSPSGKWVLGGRWNHNTWKEERTPKKEDIDDISPNNPVFLYSKEGHQALANSVALNKANITGSTDDPTGGEIQKNKSGNPTGLLFEKAIKTIEEAIPDPDYSKIKKALKSGMAKLASYGITSIHDMSRPLGLNTFIRMGEELKLRIHKILRTDNFSDLKDVGITGNFGNERLNIGPYKVFADGALGSQTAYISFDYLTRPDYRGFPIHSDQEMKKLFLDAENQGVELAIHAIGDQALNQILNTLDDLGSDTVSRIEHLQLVKTGDISKIAERNITASMQPYHLVEDRDLAEKHWGEHCERAYPINSLIQNGANVIFGSDAPISSPDPLQGIHAATTRKCGKEASWFPEECINIKKGLESYTVNPSLTTKEYDIKGTLEEGKLADMVCLSKDIFNLESPEELLDTGVIFTMFDGNIIYRNEDIDL